jgi:hypothetical protein
MSEPEISKTPWRYDAQSKCVVAANDLIVARVMSWSSPSNGDNEGALMASAPELREEVRRLREALEASRRHLLIGTPDDLELLVMIDRALDHDAVPIKSEARSDAE